MNNMRNMWKKTARHGKLMGVGGEKGGGGDVCHKLVEGLCSIVIKRKTRYTLVIFVLFKLPQPDFYIHVYNFLFVLFCREMGLPRIWHRFLT